MKKRYRNKDIKKHEFEDLNFIIDRLLAAKDLHLEKFDIQFKNHQIRENWKQIVGEAIYKHSSVHRVQKGTLYIRVDSNIWLHELKNRQQNILLKTIQEQFPHIKNLSFKFGKLEP